MICEVKNNMTTSKEERREKRKTRKDLRRQLKIFKTIKLSEPPTTFPARIRIMRPLCYLLAEIPNNLGSSFHGKLTSEGRRIMTQYLFDGVPNFYVVGNKEECKDVSRSADYVDQEKQLILNGNVLCVRGLRQSGGRIWVSRHYLTFEDFEKISDETLDKAIRTFCDPTNEASSRYSVFCPDCNEDVSKLHDAFKRAGIERVIVNYRK